MNCPAILWQIQHNWLTVSDMDQKNRLKFLQSFCHYRTSPDTKRKSETPLFMHRQSFKLIQESKWDRFRGLFCFEHWGTNECGIFFRNDILRKNQALVRKQNQSTPLFVWNVCLISCSWVDRTKLDSSILAASIRTSLSCYCYPLPIPTRSWRPSLVKSRPL